jgi:hypothetical protein
LKIKTFYGTSGESIRSINYSLYNLAEFTKFTLNVTSVQGIDSAFRGTEVKNYNSFEIVDKVYKTIFLTTGLSITSYK